MVDSSSDFRCNILISLDNSYGLRLINIFIFPRKVIFSFWSKSSSATYSSTFQCLGFIKRDSSYHITKSEMVIMNGEVEPVSIIPNNGDDSFVVLETSSSERPNYSTTDINWPQSMLQSTTTILSPSGDLVTSQSQSQMFSNTSMTNMSPEEIQKRLHDVLKENVELKETLHQNNMAMKQQFSTLQTWQEEVIKVHQNHKEKFEETKNLILKLKAENQELKKCSLMNNSITHEKATKLEEENTKLNGQIATMQEKIDNQIQKEKRLYSQMKPSAKELEFYKVVEQLTRQLEAAERARRQQTIDIERLSVQLSRTQNELMSSQQQLAHAQAHAQNRPAAESSENLELDSRLPRYEQLIVQLADSVKQEAERLTSMDTWIQMVTPGEPLQLEITELRKLLTEEQVQSVARKENLNIALNSLQELFADFKAVVREIATLKEDMIAKEKHNNEYEAIAKRSYREKLDSLTAQLVGKEEALAISERNLSSLQECLRLQNETKDTPHTSQEIKILQNKIEEMRKDIVNKDQQLTEKNEQIHELQKKNKVLETENETISLLKSQASVYQSDFEAERHSREEIATEKNRLLDDLRHLQRRNQQLLDELKSYQEQQFSLAQNSQGFDGHELTPPPKPYEEEIPPPQRYYCPNPTCNMVFNTLEPLELHVGDCLDLKD